MKSVRLALVLALACGLSAPAFADNPAQTKVEAGPGAHPMGYLDQAHLPDAARFTPPPPGLGADAAQGDLYAFHHTRALEGSDRWKLAQHDDAYDVAIVMGDFDCALGARLTPAKAPRLAALLEKLQRDSAGVVGPVKRVYKRDRPIVGNDAPFCMDRKDFKGSFSYPSGHATMSSAFALVLIELAPDRANEIMARGRAYAESRVVCGAHWPTDIEAGRIAGAATVAALHADPAFRADLEAARAEMTRLRAHPEAPDAAMCKIENAAAAERPW
jgi:acid phosphatase (class A)